MKEPQPQDPAPTLSPDAAGRHELVEAVRRACIAAALEAYQDAAVSGLCHEGRFEAAISALRRVDLELAIRGG